MVKASDEQQPRGARRHQKPGHPPPTASSTLSTAPGTICRARGADGEPHGRCVRRATAARQQQVGDVRAGNQQDERAHASRICRVRPYCSFITPTPAPAGTTAMVCLGSRRIDVGHPVGGVAGVVLHPVPQDAGEPRGHAVDRGAGPQPANHPQPRRDRLAQQRAPPRRDSGSCCSGIHRSGGLPRSVSPEAGGATPITVKGWPSMRRSSRRPRVAAVDASARRDG